MKRVKVSALLERGLRSGECRSGQPQVNEPSNSIERKADTMKTYILRDPNSVQPQYEPHPNTKTPTSLADVSSGGSQPKGPSRRTPATAPAILGRPAAVSLSPALFIGLD